MTIHQPERFRSSEKEHFKEAYRGRPGLAGTSSGFYLNVFLWAIIGVLALIGGEFLYAIGSFVLSGVSYVCWWALHNWALMHPKREDV